MCIDGDNSEHVTKYVNAQLEVLHAIGHECYSAADKESIDALPGYDFALAAFHYKQATSHTTVTFGPPTVEFICNHDALIHFNVRDVISSETKATKDAKSGTGATAGSGYGLVKDVDDSSLTVTSSAEISGPIAHLHGTVSVRVPWVKFDLSGQADILGAAPRTVNTLILDIPHARIVSTDISSLNVAKGGLLTLFEAYLKHFHKSGHHILHSLPPFDDVHFHRTMDFSAVTTYHYDHIKEMYNIALQRIDRHLRNAWRTAAWRVMMQKGEPALAMRRSIAIAEWRSSWAASAPGDWHFNVKFGAPRVELLCDHEAIIHLHVDEVRFSKTPNFGPGTQTHEHWDIAIVVNIQHFVEEDGAIQILNIDTKHGGKFAQALSFYTLDLEDETNLTIFTQFISFLSVQYLQILEEGGLYFYRWDSRARSIEAVDVFHAHTHSGDDYEDDIVSQADMRGFQQIIILSQASLDEVCRTAYEAKENSWMQKIQIEGQFIMHFGTPKVRLLSTSRALVFIPVTTGKLRTYRDSILGSVEHNVSNWELAFDVGLRMVDAFEYDEWYKGSLAHKLFIKYPKNSMKHLILDFSTAEFQFDLSRFDDANFEDSYDSLEKAASALHFLREHYFKAMQRSTARILYTVPLWRTQSEDRPRYAFSDVTFHLYSKITVTHHNYNIIAPGEEPVIAILGMINPKLKLPSTVLRFSTHWLLNYGASFGTLALSRDVFLHGRLLPLLESVNRATTLLPASLDMDAGNWLVQLTTWKAKYAGKLDRAASWEELPRSHNAFEFKWDYTDEYEYNHEGRAGDKAAGSNFLSLKTDNRLTIPTSFKAGQLDITMRGTTTVAVGWTRAEEEVRMTSTASWTIIISAVTNAEGLKIHVSQAYVPKISDETITGEVAEYGMRLHPKGLIESSMPKDVELSTEIEALRTFEGIWRGLYPGVGSYKLANPFFTARGDLLVELRSDSPDSTQPIIRVVTGKDLPSSRPRPIINRGASGFRRKSGSNGSSPVTPLSGLPIGSPVTPADANGNGNANGNGLKKLELTPGSPTLDKAKKPATPTTAGNGTPFGKAATE